MESFTIKKRINSLILFLQNTFFLDPGLNFLLHPPLSSVIPKALSLIITSFAYNIIFSSPLRLSQMNRIYPRNLSNFTHELTHHTPAALKKERKKERKKGGIAYVWVNVLCCSTPSPAGNKGSGNRWLTAITTPLRSLSPLPLDYIIINIAAFAFSNFLERLYCYLSSPHLYCLHSKTKREFRRSTIVSYDRRRKGKYNTIQYN